jgi:hypothetical protein
MPVKRRQKPAKLDASSSRAGRATALSIILATGSGGRSVGGALARLGSTRERRWDLRGLQLASRPISGRARLPRLRQLWVLPPGATMTGAVLI